MHYIVLHHLTSYYTNYVMCIEVYCITLHYMRYKYVHVVLLQYIYMYMYILINIDVNIAYISARSCHLLCTVRVLSEVQPELNLWWRDSPALTVAFRRRLGEAGG